MAVSSNNLYKEFRCLIISSAPKINIGILMSMKIFISHAAADEKLATAHVDCIYSCMVPGDDEVRCTSVPGHKLPIDGDAATILRMKFFYFY